MYFGCVFNLAALIFKKNKLLAMTFKYSMTLQGILGIFFGFLFLLLPELILDFITPDYNSTSMVLFRTLGLFIIILCFVLLFIRSITSIPIQKKVLLVNMIGDFCIMLLLLWATIEELLSHTGGWLLTLFMLSNALSYVPVYWKLRGL